MGSVRVSQLILAWLTGSLPGRQGPLSVPFLFEAAQQPPDLAKASEKKQHETGPTSGDGQPKQRALTATPRI